MIPEWTAKPLCNHLLRSSLHNIAMKDLQWFGGGGVQHGHAHAGELEKHVRLRKSSCL